MAGHAPWRNLSIALTTELRCGSRQTAGIRTRDRWVLCSSSGIHRFHLWAGISRRIPKLCGQETRESGKQDSLEETLLYPLSYLPMNGETGTRTRDTCSSFGIL